MATQYAQPYKNKSESSAAAGRTWPLLGFLWLSTALPELLLHLATSKNSGTLFSSGLLLAPLFALVPALILFLICTTIPKRWINYCTALLYCAVVYLLCASQFVYYKIFGTFYTVYSMVNGGAAFQFVNTIGTAIWENLPLLLIMALPLMTMIILGLRIFSFQPIKAPRIKMILAILTLAIHLGLVLMLPVFGGTGDTSAYGLYHNASDSYTSVNKLGLLTAFRLNLTRTISGDSADGSIVIQAPTTEITETTEPTQFTETEAAPEESVTETTVPVETEPEPEYNVLNIDFDDLIAQSDNKSVTQLHQYFAGRTASLQNDKTGMFNGCNLIMLTAEAFSYLIVDPERTPTLYRLMSEGISFSNYYVPDWGVSTTDGEYAFLTGTIPKDGVWSFKQSAENDMPLTMSMQLIDQGYNAYAYHGHTYTYYGRNLYLSNLGFDYKGYGGGLDVTYQWPESDVEVMEHSISDYIGSSPFVTYYMTISGHREFNFYGNRMAAKNKELVTDEPYSEAVRAYIACQLELEHALTILMEELESAGILENTVIVLTADHYPNGLTNAEISELLGHDVESNFEIYQNGAFIWKYGMEPEVVDTPTSHLDLLPTLSNLFGLEFDSRLYMGRDVFSDAKPLVIFRNRSWITDQAMYNAETGEVISLTGEQISDDYISAIKTEVNNRFTVSARILEYDYWSILFDE